MKLTKQQRQRIQDRQHPHIRFPREKACPALVGEVVRVGRDVSLTVIRIRWTRTEWVVEYNVHDFRPMLLRSGAPIRTFDEREEAKTWTEEEEHGYTTDPHQALRQEPEAVDRKELGRQVAESRARWSTYQEEIGEEDRRQQRAVRQKLREAYPELDVQARIALIAGIERLITEALESEEA